MRPIGPIGPIGPMGPMRLTTHHSPKMTFHFPNYDTLRFALAGGTVPPEVGLAPARVGVDADGRPWLTPDQSPSQSLQTALRRFGVRGDAIEPAGGAAVAH